MKTFSRQYESIYICKPDLDTVTTAFLLGVNPEVPLFCLTGDAPEYVLVNPTALCVECGGSGRTDESNFDHHGTQLLPCAAEQAWTVTGSPARYQALVQHVAAVDTGQGCSPSPMPLSALFSGMLLTETTAAGRFRMGFELLRVFDFSSCDPLDIRGLLTIYPPTQVYLNAKRNAHKRLTACAASAKTFRSGGLTVMQLIAPVPGIHGLLRRLGADISIAGSSSLPRHWSIASRRGLENRIQAILSRLNAKDPGWGGPSNGSIIGGPRTGSTLSSVDIVNIVTSTLASCHL